MTSRKSGDRQPTVDLEALVGPLSAALAPQITKMVEAEFTRRALASQSSTVTGRGTVNKAAEGGGNDTSQNESSDEGLAGTDGDIDSHSHDHIENDFEGPVTKNKTGSSPSHINRKRKREDEEELGELSDSMDENDRLYDPIEMYRESKATWKVPKETEKYLEMYTKRSLNKDERRSMADTFSKPDVLSVSMPRVDDSFLNLLRQQGVSLK